MAHGSELFTVGALEGMGLIGPHLDECAAVPDLTTATILPGTNNTAGSPPICYHGEPYQNCSRVILKKALTRAADRGSVRSRH